MGFLEDIQEDIDELFFDEDFFGSVHVFDGKKLVVILADDELADKDRAEIQQRRIYRDEVVKNSVLLYVKEADMERKLSVNSPVELDSKTLFVNEISKQNGVWKLLLGKEQI